MSDAHQIAGESLAVDKPWLMLGDCLERMREIPDGSVDMVLCDLPYQVTACAWDSQISIEPLWAHYRRVIKRNGAIILTATQPFTSMLIMSNLLWFKYEWIWEKARGTGHVHANNKPLRTHENILVFSPGTTVHANQSRNRMTYNPQKIQGKEYRRLNVEGKNGSINHVPSKANKEITGSISLYDGKRFPRSVQFFSNPTIGNVHPTQKPVPLFEYLIRTYTNPRGVVLDNCFGSGTTGVACANTGRRFIGIERDPHYFDIGRRRIDQAITAAAQPAQLGGLFDAQAAE